MDFLNLGRALDAAQLMEDAGLTPDPWQCRALRSTSKRLLLLAARQSGKSTTTSCIALHEALYRSGAMILLVSRSERQSGELFRKVLESYHRLDSPVPAVRELAFSLELANKSRIIALPGDPDTIRGFSGVTTAIVDEAAQVGDALFVAVMPMLAVTQGRMICLSTPFGRRGWFCEKWEATDPGWERIAARASECPRIDPEFLEEQKRSLGPRWYAQEYECEFVEDFDQVFSTDSVQAIFSGDAPILAGF